MKKRIDFDKLAETSGISKTEMFTHIFEGKSSLDVNVKVHYYTHKATRYSIEFLEKLRDVTMMRFVDILETTKED